MDTVKPDNLINPALLSAREDQSLIDWFLQGNQEAFSRLVTKYRKQAYAIAYRFTQNHEEADDLAQETFVTAFDKLHTFRGEASFKTWLLRITTNLQVYWDRIAIVYGEPDPGVVKHLAKPVEARLQRVGFPRRSTGPQMLPHYDYAVRTPFWDTRYMDGAYTAFGRVDALVRETDDAVAIFGPGEEVSLAYDAPPQPEPGSSRVYVLEARGWCKDMDLYTHTGETVGPLPRSGKPAAPRDQLHARFNTRYRSGL